MILNPIVKQKCMKLAEPIRALTILFWIDTNIIDDITRPDKDELLRRLEFAQLIEKRNGQYTLREPLYVPDEVAIVADNPTMTSRNARMLVMEKVDEYRACFSKDGKGNRGLRPGALGDKLDIIKKLVKWFKDTNFTYTMDDVINTAKVYVESCKEDRYRYLQSADYFISKDGRSRLSSYIDEFKDKPTTPNSDIESYNELV